MARRSKERKTWTADEARAVLALWEDSGQSGRAFADSLGVVPQRLFWWKRRLAPGGPDLTTRPGKPAFVPVTVSGVAPLVLSASVVVTTLSGVRLEVNEVNAASAAWVVAVLRGEGQP